MDTVTTAIGGALLGRALPEDRRGPIGVAVVTLASVVPDADIIFEAFNNDPLGGLTQHRAITHSLLGAAILGPLLALACWRFGKDKNYRRLLLLSLFGLFWHMFTDLATSWGTMVFYPFNRDRVVWDLLFIIDFTFSAILLLPHVVAWIYSQPQSALRRGGLIWTALVAFTALAISLVSPMFRAEFDWGLFGLFSALLAFLFLLPRLRGWGFRQRTVTFCRIGVASLAVYLGVCTVAHFRAVRLVESMAREKKLTVRSLGALPQPLSPFRWSGLVLTPEGVFQSWFNLLDSGTPQYQFFPTEENGYVERARQLPEVQTYLWFARFPVAQYRDEAGRHIVDFSDRRFQSQEDRNPGFIFRVVFDAGGKVHSKGFVGR
jgi:inner membrane protein